MIARELPLALRIESRAGCPRWVPCAWKSGVLAPALAHHLRTASARREALAARIEEPRLLALPTRELIVEAIAEHDIPDDLRDLVVGGLWGLQMSSILYALYDYSPGLARTRRLTDGVLNIFVQLLDMASISALQPVLKPIRARLLSLLRDAGLLPPAPAYRGLQPAPLLGSH